MTLQYFIEHLSDENAIQALCMLLARLDVANDDVLMDIQDELFTTHGLVYIDDTGWTNTRFIETA